MYMEDVSSGKRFVDVAGRVSQDKPVIILKSGQTEAGKQAVSSHTASLAGNDDINSAAFRQGGIIRARDNEHLFSLARAFSKQPIPAGKGVMVITYTGSMGVAATDMLYLSGLRLAKLEPHLKERLTAMLPKYLSINNPIDCSFSMTPEQVKNIVEIGILSQDVNSFIVIIQGEILDSFVDMMKNINYRGKPIVCCVACKEFMMDSVIKMEQAGIPVYSTAEMAAEVLGEMYRYGQRRQTVKIKTLEQHLTDSTVVINNKTIRFRLLRQKDMDLWTDFVNGCSPQSLWLRFLSSFSATPENARRFCEINPEDEVAVVAEMVENGNSRLVGIARLSRIPRCNEAEYAVIISDPWQKKTLGHMLSKRCVELAKYLGVKAIHSETLQENFPMTRILNHCQFRVRDKEKNMVLMSRQL
jgi:RimJ/RimL family protein N-acetyltransferase